MLKRKILTLTMIFLLVGGAVCVSAEDLIPIFDKQTSYDIYLQSDYSTMNVITDVNILRLQEIGGRTFLVVRPSEFILNNTDAFILFEAVKAILPNQKIKVRNTTKFNANW